ncbi:MAG TPA: M6 family metalloprotease domain-containing protein [Longimicrobium sp.]|nr:M6 family metalloprotease domain-containing protein [Longimicrobium sp.]
MTMHRLLSLLAVAGAISAIPGATARAQSADIETAAAARGIPLPAGYYERVRRDPDFFEFRHPRRVDLSGSRPGVPGGVSAAVLPSEGEMRMAVVMALFSDSPEPPLSSATTHQQLFGQNPLGNLTEFYREMSRGKVSVTGTVFPWVRTGATRTTTVGSTMGLGGDAQLGPYMLDALAQLDATVNFGQYDNDGPDGVPNSGDDDGLVDITVFQYAEVAASCGSGGSYGPWPHRSTVRNWTEGHQPWMTNDLRPNGQPVGVDDYIMQSVVDCDGAPQTIATIAHETGHAFGLPDFYHPVGGILPTQRRWVMGCFALMAAGSWGCGDGSTFVDVQRPSHMGAYEKRIMGWSDEVAAGDAAAQLFTLPPVQSTGRTLRIPLRGLQEYLLLEYRPNTGFDAGLPANGVLIYHVEPARPLRPCATCPRIYHVSLKEADGDGALLRTAEEGGNRGVAGDVFTGTRILSDATTPSLRLNSGEPSNLALSIVVAGGQAQVGLFRRTVFPQDRLLGPYLGTTPLTNEEQVAADLFGNGNGRFDLGDVRIHLRSSPAG